MLILRRAGQPNRRQFPLAALLDTGTGAVTVTPAVAAAVAAAPDPTVQAGSAVTVTPPVAASAATALAPSVRLGAITLTPANASAATSARFVLLCGACTYGVLTVDATNPRYFRNNGGTIVLSGTWWWHTQQDGAATDPPPATDWAAYLAYTVARGGNLIKHSMQESPRNWPDVAPYYYEPLPWARTGPGTAADGKARFDLTSWDSTYFTRLRTRTIEAGNAGMYVVVQLAQGWQIDNKSLGSGNPWTYHPMQAGNNINGVDGDANNDGIGNDTRDSANATLFNLWKALYEQMYATVGDLDNVLWEISNEDGTYSRQWQWDFIDYIHGYESTGGRKVHPVGMTWIYPGGSNSTDLYASPADWVSPGANDSTPLGNLPTWPEAGASGKVGIGDTDHWGGIVYDDKFPFKAFTRGYNPLWMDKYDGSLYGGDIRSDATSEKIRYQMGYVRNYAARMDLRYSTPQGSLASTGYAIARTTGLAKILAYQPTSGAFTVDLTGITGTWAIEWLRTGTGATQSGGTVAGGAVRTLTPPWASEDVVAFLERTADSLTPAVASAAATAVSPTILIGGITVLPSAAASTATAIAPTVIYGALAVTPAQASASATAISPTVIHGALAVIPAVASAAGAAVPPTVVYGAVSLAPAVAAAVATAIAPSVQAGGAVSLAPAPAATAATAIAPTVVLGAVTVLPAVASVAAAAVSPAVVYGALSITPTTATAAATAIAPTVLIGAASITPAPAAAVAVAVAPGVVYGATTATPAAASAQATAIAPTILAGGITLAPAAAAMAASALAPLVVYGAVSLGPDPAQAAGAALAPGVIYGPTSVVPAAATAAASSMAPTVIIGVIAALITLHAERRFTLSSTRNFDLTFDRRQ